MMPWSNLIPIPPGITANSHWLFLRIAYLILFSYYFVPIKYKLFEIQGHIFHFLLATVCSLMFFCLEMSKIAKDREVEEVPVLSAL